MVDIPKIMIFFDSINVGIVIEKYLQCILSVLMQDKKKIIIVFFNSNYEADIPNDFIENFQRGNTCIMVCTDAAKMGIDLPDVARAVQ